MVSNPGNYVALILIGSVNGESEFSLRFKYCIMGNCQASDSASIFVEHPGGKIDKIYWAVSANKVMVSNPGNYVALILTGSVKGESDDGAHKHLKLLIR